jgi:TonB family protein
MTEAVTDIIVARARQVDSLKPTVVWSVTAHVVVGVLVVVFAGRAVPEPAPNVMTISLGGAPGPKTSGMTQAAGRTVQAEPPAERTRQTSAPQPKQPEMTLPDPRARNRPRPRAEQAPADATSRTPSTGEQPSEGPARSQVRGQGFGLSSGGGPIGGVDVDVSDFCCPEYLERMVTQIQRNWQQNQGYSGATIVRFTIRRDGVIAGAEVMTPSGVYELDAAALRALAVTKQLPPLPAQYQTLGVRLTFQYRR